MTFVISEISLGWWEASPPTTPITFIGGRLLPFDQALDLAGAGYQGHQLGNFLISREES